jgi:hypothetical protein
MYPETRNILEFCAENQSILSICSRSPDINIVEQILKAFGIWEWFLFPQVYYKRKTFHFRNLTEITNFQMKDFLFFDDENANITMCNRLGVTSILVSKESGLTWERFVHGLETYQEKLRTQRCLTQWLQQPPSSSLSSSSIISSQSIHERNEDYSTQSDVNNSYSLKSTNHQQDIIIAQTESGSSSNNTNNSSNDTGDDNSSNGNNNDNNSSNNNNNNNNNSLSTFLRPSALSIPRPPALTLIRSMDQQISISPNNSDNISMYSDNLNQLMMPPPSIPMTMITPRINLIRSYNNNNNNSDTNSNTLSHDKPSPKRIHIINNNHPQEEEQQKQRDDCELQATVSIDRMMSTSSVHPNVLPLPSYAVSREDSTYEYYDTNFAHLIESLSSSSMSPHHNPMTNNNHHPQIMSTTTTTTSTSTTIGLSHHGLNFFNLSLQIAAANDHTPLHSPLSTPLGTPLGTPHHLPQQQTLQTLPPSLIPSISSSNYSPSLLLQQHHQHQQQQQSSPLHTLQTPHSHHTNNSTNSTPSIYLRYALQHNNNNNNNNMTNTTSPRILHPHPHPLQHTISSHTSSPSSTVTAAAAAAAATSSYLSQQVELQKNRFNLRIDIPTSSAAHSPSSNI